MHDVCGKCRMTFGRTCCEDKGGDSFPLTINEATRIAKHTGKSMQDAVTVRRVLPEEHGELLKNQGAQIASIVSKGVGIYLPRDELGRCLYLKGAKCSITDAKPGICAMFPLRRVDGIWKLWKFVGAGFCLAQDLAVNLTHAMDMFGYTFGSLDRVYERWKQDVEDHNNARGS